jgi:hypothetical protein
LWYFVVLYKKAFVDPAGLKWKILAGAAVTLLLFEGLVHVNATSRTLTHRIPVLEDKENLLEANRWVDVIEPSEFQAIIPMPYFHVGSENIWIEGALNIKEHTMMASLKTGLPTTGVMLSRTSVSQTYINYAVHCEPLERLEFTDFLPDEKPFLILLMNGYTPQESEKLLLEQARPVAESDLFRFYSLPVSAIRRLNIAYREKLLQGYSQANLYAAGDFQVTRSGAFFVVETFDSKGISQKL